jgi:pimeloyl-ACP methyl ester carboxylesterase
VRRLDRAPAFPSLSFLRWSTRFASCRRPSRLEKIAFTTKDHRKLSGYKLGAYADSSREQRGYVLVALGNAMLADQVLREVRFLQAEGRDVYIYDYRGYGISEGKSRFNAIRTDYVELIYHLNEVGYPNRFLYGMSIGGVFLLNAISADGSYDAALIDSPPSRISGYGCPRRFDPVENVPLDGSRLGFICGHRDRVVPPDAWREPSTIARARGAFVLEGANLAHPMMDQDPIARMWSRSRYPPRAAARTISIGAGSVRPPSGATMAGARHSASCASARRTILRRRRPTCTYSRARGRPGSSCLPPSLPSRSSIVRKDRRPSHEVEAQASQVKLVAGAGFEPATFRL